MSGDAKSYNFFARSLACSIPSARLIQQPLTLKASGVTLQSARRSGCDVRQLVKSAAPADFDLGTVHSAGPAHLPWPRYRSEGKEEIPIVTKVDRALKASYLQKGEDHCNTLSKAGFETCLGRTPGSFFRRHRCRIGSTAENAGVRRAPQARTVLSDR